MAKKQTEDNCKTYHHGDLRNTLIIAAAELINERGSEGFAMIDAARKAGVSSAAPYRHFKDKEELLRAVSELGFYSLTLQLADTASHYPRGSTESIIELGKCYIRFVSGHPAFYDLMWGDLGSRSIDDEYSQLKSNGFWILVNAIEAWCATEKVHDSDPLDLSLKLWAMGLGLSSLTINQHLQRFVPDVDVYELLATSTRSFLLGVKKES